MYGNELLTVNQYFDKFIETCSNSDISPSQAFALKVVFVGGFHAALAAVEKIHKLENDFIKNKKFFDLFNQVSEIAQIVILFDELMKKENT